MPSTLEDHVVYTRKEWTEQPYYVNVVNFLKEKKIKTMVDAGGCTGEVTKIIIENIDTLEKSFIIEASKINSDFIKKHLIFDNVDIQIINNFLYYGEDVIKIGLNSGDNNVGGYSMKRSDNIIEECIPTITLESIHEDVDFIKIDIEGAEDNVIINSSKIKEIKFIEIEFHDDLQNMKWKSFIENNLNTHKVVFDDGHSHAFLELK
jgi:FkbM family methyltransferase